MAQYTKNGEIAAYYYWAYLGEYGLYYYLKNSFIKGLRELCDQEDIIIDFWWVMTGFSWQRVGAKK